MLGMTRNATLACSFCGRDADTVARFLGGPGVHICDTCVGHCTRMLDATPQDFTGWKDCSDEALLSLLPVTEAAIEGTRTIMTQQIGELRRRKVSWQAIGAALGISRQAAWERFS